MLIEHNVLGASRDRSRAVIENTDALFTCVRDDFIHPVGQYEHEDPAEPLRDE